MQTDKAFVPVGGIPLIEQVLQVIIFSVINSNTPAMPWTVFLHKGLNTALTHSDYTFCVAYYNSTFLDARCCTLCVPERRMDSILYISTQNAAVSHSRIACSEPVKNFKLL